MFGIHAASIGGAPAFIAKEDEMVCNMIYTKLRTNPSPKYIPIPPFLFLEDKEAPIIVRIKEANDVAIRLWYST